jgi:LL-diaminopimelate aminotransferase
MKSVEQTTGKDVLNFAVGEPDVEPCHEYVLKFAEYVQDTNLYKYPGYGASKAFSDAIISWYMQRFDVSLDESELLPLNGAKDGITHLPLALLNPDDEILVPEPGYPAFSSPALMVGAIPVYYQLDPNTNFKINYDLLGKQLTKRTKYIWANFPSNPTGQVASMADLKQLVMFARQNNIYILYDNAYSEITFDGYKAPSILNVDDAKDIAIEIGSFSKSFSFAGLRMGWAVGNRNIIAALRSVKSQYDSGQSLPFQKLGAYALTHPNKDWQKQMLDSYATRRNIIATYLDKMGMTFDLPKGSLYIWAKLPDSLPDAEKYCKDLLVNKRVLFTPGTAFGKNFKRYIRVSIGTNVEHIEEHLG